MMAAAEQPISLVLGDFTIAGGIPDTYTVSAHADDATWGNPQPVEVAVQTLLQNSSAVVTERYDNREAFIRVEIRAEDGISLAEGEAALFAELGKPNLLTWTPPKGFAPATVFRVITSSMEHAFDDFGELYGRRVYGVRLVCEAFARSADEVVVEAQRVDTDGGGTPVPLVDTLVDACNSAAGWSALGSGQTAVVSLTGTTVRNNPATQFPQLKRTGTIDMTGTPILVVDVKMTQNSTWVPAFTINGGLLRPDALLAVEAAPEPGHTRYYLDCPVTTITSLQIGRLSVGRQGATSSIPDGFVGVAEIRKRNNPPASGTLRQKFFTAAVAGSAPAEGSVEIYSSNGADLGLTIAYTYSNDEGQAFVPALRRTFDAATSAPITDATTVSGAFNDIGAANTVRAVLPVDQVPSGTYELGAMLRSSTTGTKTVTVTIDSVGGGPDTQTLTTSVTFAAANTWGYYSLGRVQLPLNRVTPGSTATVRATIGQASGAGTVTLDEAYLFNLDRGALTIVDATTFPRVTLSPATLEWPRPSVLFGGDDTGAGAIAIGSRVRAWGTHEVKPSLLNTFVVTAATSGGLNPGVRLRLVPAWHTHAAQ